MRLGKLPGGPDPPPMPGRRRERVCCRIPLRLLFLGPSVVVSCLPNKAQTARAERVGSGDFTRPLRPGEHGTEQRESCLPRSNVAKHSLIVIVTCVSLCTLSASPRWQTETKPAAHTHTHTRAHIHTPLKKRERHVALYLSIYLSIYLPIYSHTFVEMYVCFFF